MVPGHNTFYLSWVPNMQFPMVPEIPNIRFYMVPEPLFSNKFMFRVFIYEIYKCGTPFSKKTPFFKKLVVFDKKLIYGRPKRYDTIRTGTIPYHYYRHKNPNRYHDFERFKNLRYHWYRRDFRF